MWCGEYGGYEWCAHGEWGMTSARVQHAGRIW